MGLEGSTSSLWGAHVSTEPTCRVVFVPAPDSLGEMDDSRTTSPPRATPLSLVRRGLLRASISLAVMWGMALAQQLTHQPSGVRSTLVVGVIVAAVAGFSVIYDIESWSVLKQSLVHTGCMAVIVLPCLVFSGWFTIDGPRDVLAILGYFVVTGIVIWSIGYLVFGKLMNGSSRGVRDDAS